MKLWLSKSVRKSLISKELEKCLSGLEESFCLRTSTKLGSRQDFDREGKRTMECLMGTGGAEQLCDVVPNPEDVFNM